MTRPTDASLARAFRELSRNMRASIGQPWTLDYFVLMVNKCAERFDAEPKSAAPYDPSCGRCKECRTGKRCRNLPEEAPDDLPTWDRLVRKFDRCPKCTAHMPVGQTCGGKECGLRGKE